MKCCSVFQLEISSELQRTTDSYQVLTLNSPANVPPSAHTAYPAWHSICIKKYTEGEERGEEIGCSCLQPVNPALLHGLTGMESSAFHLVFISDVQSIPIAYTTHTVINNVTETIKHAWATVLHHTGPNDFPPWCDWSLRSLFSRSYRKLSFLSLHLKQIKTKELNLDERLERWGKIQHFLSLTLCVFYSFCE